MNQSPSVNLSNYEGFYLQYQTFFPLYLFLMEIGKPTTSMFLKCLYVVQLTRAELVP